MHAIRVDEPHAAEPRDAVVDVNDQLAWGELKGELSRQLFGTRAGRGSPSRRWPAHAAEQLCVGEQVEPDRGLRAPRRQVLLGQVQARVQLHVDVEVGLLHRRTHGVGLKKLPEAVVLLGGHDHCRTFGLLRERGQRLLAADQRFGVSPADVKRLTVQLAGRHLDGRTRRVQLQARELYRRKLESRGKLAVLGLGCGQHGGVLGDGARVGQLSLRLEVENHDLRGQVVEQRRPAAFQVGGVELDTRECRARFQPRQVVVPLRAHVGAKRQDVQLGADPMGGQRSPLRPDRQLAAGADDNPTQAHNRPLVGWVEHTQSVDGVAEPLRAGGRVRSGRKHVEDAAAQ